MINYDDNDTSLLSFYNISTVNPASKEDLKLTSQEYIDSDELNNLSIDDQFNVLSVLVNANAGHNNNSSYRYDDEDHEDPLRGRGTSVIKQLMRREVISSKNDPKLNQFLISSQNFDSQRFLTTVHQDSSIDDLVQSLNFLERNIQSETAELKMVIDSNFMKFVDCKKSIDDVLVDFKNSKTKSQQERANSKVFNPQRKKNMNINESLSSDLEESIKNINMASTLLIRPIVENKNKEQKLNTLIEFIKSYKFFFDLPHDLIDSLSTQNHDKFIDDYHRFLKEKEEFSQKQEEKYERDIAQLDPEKDNQAIESVHQNQQLVNTALSKVFYEVDNITAEYRKKIYNELLSLDHEVGNSSTNFPKANNARFISLVDKLYQLNKKDNNVSNPIYEFLTTQLNGLRKDLDYQINKFEAKFTMMQRKLVDYINSLAEHREGGSHVRHIIEKYNNIDDYFRASSTSSAPTSEEYDRVIVKFFDSSDNLDLSFINETWLVLLNFINYLDDLFLRSMTKFVNNYNHYCNPKNVFNIDTDGKIRNSYVDLVVHVTNTLTSLFNENSEDLRQVESSPENYSHFLPYHTNSLSTVFYLSNISTKINHSLTKIGKYMAIVGNANKSTDTNKIIKLLRTASGTINQRILEANCAVWVNDCSQFYDLENWDVYHPIYTKNQSATFTKAINVLEYYEGYFLQKISDLVFSKDNEDMHSDEDIRIIASYPSKRTLVSVEIQFMRSLNVLIDSLMKKYNVEKSNTKVNNNNLNIDSELFKVLTMNNFDRLSSSIYPGLIKKFDKLFGKNLSQQNLKLYADIDKAGLTILDDILLREKSWIDERVSKYFLKVSSKILNSNDRNVLKVDSFIYEVLVHFVKLIHVVKPLTGIDMFVNIMNELQNYFLKLVLEYLRSLTQNDAFYALLGSLKLGIIFFVEVFEPSKYAKLNDYCMNLVDIILGTINENETNPSYTDDEFDKALMLSLKDSESEFDCFL